MSRFLVLLWLPVWKVSCQTVWSLTHKPYHSQINFSKLLFTIVIDCDFLESHGCAGSQCDAKCKANWRKPLHICAYLHRNVSYGWLHKDRQMARGGIFALFFSVDPNFKCSNLSTVLQWVTKNIITFPGRFPLGNSPEISPGRLTRLHCPRTCLHKVQKINDSVHKWNSFSEGKYSQSSLR